MKQRYQKLCSATLIASQLSSDTMANQNVYYNLSVLFFRNLNAVFFQSRKHMDMQHLPKYSAITTTASPLFRTLEKKTNLCKALQKVLIRIFLLINAFTLKKNVFSSQHIDPDNFFIFPFCHNTLNTQPATSFVKHD